MLIGTLIFFMPLVIFPITFIVLMVGADIFSKKVVLIVSVIHASHGNFPLFLVVFGHYM